MPEVNGDTCGARALGGIELAVCGAFSGAYVTCDATVCGDVVIGCTTVTPGAKDTPFCAVLPIGWHPCTAVLITPELIRRIFALLAFNVSCNPGGGGTGDESL